MSNLSIPPAEWLAEQFECDYCAECHGDTCHHTAVPFMGNWFARCNFPSSDDGTTHPVIIEFHVKAGNSDLVKILSESLD